MRVGLVLGLMAWATSAVADCPTRDDLKTGIKVTYSKGGPEVFRLGPDDHMNKYHSVGENSGIETSLLHGHYEAEITYVDNGRARAQSPHVVFAYTHPPRSPQDYGRHLNILAY